MQIDRQLPFLHQEFLLYLTLLWQNKTLALKLIILGSGTNNNIKN